MPSAALYIREDSSFYWLAIYNKYESNPNKKRVKFSTGIQVTKADQQRYIKWKKNGAPQNHRPSLMGNENTRKLIRDIKESQLKDDIQRKTRVKIKRRMKLSEGLEEYIQTHTRIGDKQSLSVKTIKSYRTAVGHLISATEADKEIHKYYKAIDFNMFLAYMEDHDYAEATRTSFTKTLASLWNYFIDQGYATEQLIEIYKSSKIQKPEDIPLDEFNTILKFYEKSYPDRWEFIYYLLLTMNRPSTAMMQKRSDINFKKNYILMPNVKAKRKSANRYAYPIFDELEKLLNRILQRPVADSSDRLFANFKIGTSNYTDSLWWWYVDQKRLHLRGLISQTYELKQIRKTFPSFAINEIGMLSEEIRHLLDHTDKSVSENFYINERLDKIRARLEKKRLMESMTIEEIKLEPQEIELSPEEINLRIDEIFNFDERKTLEITKKELKKKLWEKPITEIAKEYNVSDSAIHKRIKKWNLEKPEPGYWAKKKGKK